MHVCAYLLADTRLLCKLIYDLALNEGRVHVKEDQSPVSSEKVVILQYHVFALIITCLEHSGKISSSSPAAASSLSLPPFVRLSLSRSSSLPCKQA